MSMITGSIKGLLQIKFKARHDPFTDQYNRIFMVKMAMISSMLLGLNWFKDTITCIVPGTAGINGGFVNEACWIQGKEIQFVISVLIWKGCLGRKLIFVYSKPVFFFVFVLTLLTYYRGE